MDKSRILSSLHSVYAKREDFGDIKELVTALEALKINSLVNYFVYHKSDFDDEEIQIINTIIKILQYIYNNSDVLPPISDELYDQLYAIMLDGTGTDIVGADVGSHRKIVHHEYPDLRGTLDKVHFIHNSEKGPREKRKSVQDWVSGVESTIGREIDGVEGDILIFPKFDGVSVIFECDQNGNIIRAITRGDTVKNEATDISHIFGCLKFRPNPEWRGDEFGVKTEVVMRFPQYEKFNKKYGPFKNTRSAVSSIVNSKEFKTDYLKYVTIVPLRMQNKRTHEIILHPDTDKYPMLSGSMKLIDGLENAFTTIRNYVEYYMEIPIDGCVLYIANRELQRAMGRNDAINKYEVAYKYPAEATKTILLDVDFSVGVMGSITPVAKVKPVKMSGNTISSISLGSMDVFESLNLHYGDEVIVKYNIIPYMTKDDTCTSGDGEKIKSPTHCKFCGEELLHDPILMCTNIECPCRMIGKIVNYLDKMNIMNIAEGTVTTLFNKGIVTCIEDLYSLTKKKNEVLAIGGFGDRSFENMLKGIKARKKVDDYVLMGSLGIPNIGRKIFKRILNIYYIDELIQICNKGKMNKLTEIKGISDKTANMIIVGVLMNEDLIAFLQEELTIIPSKGGADKEQVLFTKVRDKNFESFLIEKRNVEVASSFNKKIRYLIVPSLEITSNKVDEAKKHGVEIITLDQAYKVFGYTQD